MAQWLRAQLLWKRTGVQFPEYVKMADSQLLTPAPGVSDALFWPSWALHSLIQPPSATYIGNEILQSTICRISCLAIADEDELRYLRVTRGLIRNP